MGLERKVVIASPAMPDWLEWLKLENLKVGDGAVSLMVHRTHGLPAIEVLNKRGAVAVEIRRYRTAYAGTANTGESALTRWE
jgi:hypothetical protein